MRCGRRRRGQMLGHIVVYVIGLIIISLVLVFGYQQLTVWQERQCSLSRTTFATQLSSDFDTSLGWGTNDIIRLAAPCNTEILCLVDRGFIDYHADSISLPTYPDSLSFASGDNYKEISPQQKQVINRSASLGIPSNVFTVDQEGNVEAIERFTSISAPVDFKVENDRYAFCMSAQSGFFNIRTIGTGSSVKVSPYVS